MENIQENLQEYILWYETISNFILAATDKLFFYIIFGIWQISESDSES